VRPPTRAYRGVGESRPRRHTDQLRRPNDGGILWLVFEPFCDIDLHPEAVSCIETGYLFEELIRRFPESRTKRPGSRSRLAQICGGK
jgi:hypothetical protein